MAARGTPPPQRQDLSRAQDRLSFLYVERATIHREGNALTLSDERGVMHVPASSLGALLLGPGTRITHGAMGVAGDSGVSIVWVGENGTRYYAHGRPLAKSSRMAEAQARCVTNQRHRLRTARAMYAMRFPGEDISALSMSQLRGREGARMKRIYAEEARRAGISWTKRSYSPDDFNSSDDINRSLTSAHAALYGITHAVIVSLGFIPSLGVVHNGTDRALIYDIADLYKADISIPAAFDAAASETTDPAGEARREVRDRIVAHRLLPRMVSDLHTLFEVEPDLEFSDADLLLWSELEAVPTGTNWADVI